MPLKPIRLVLVVTLLSTSLLAITSQTKAADAFELIETENHHIAGLNSSQPYVAGFHVNTPDLETRECVLATAVTVSFPSTDTSYFPSDSWLGGGMFVQAQDSKLRYVDYGFYTMLVLDFTGNFFLDVGLHQTREETAPLQAPSAQLVFAYTWQIRGIDPEKPVTLTANWDSEGLVHYSISTSEFNVTLPAVNVVDLPNCGSMIRRFYAGNVVVGPFPFSRYVQYFQFGVLSSTSITNNDWSVHLREPQLLRETGWNLVDTAWSIRGDISYLDYSWMWGGQPYQGVSAEYYRNPLQTPYEILFFYNGNTLPSGTVLWQPTVHDSSGFSVSMILSVFSYCMPSFLVLTLILSVQTDARHKLRKSLLGLHRLTG